MSHASTITGDSLIGATLAGRYRVEARVGSGAMGAVYRAEQAGLGRRVALKILNRDRHVGGDTVQRFRREAQALSALHHPNTVRVFDFGSSDEGLLYLAMELLEGESLTDRLVREGPLPVADAVHIIQQVLRSIGEAHAQGIVHRDLKPDNVFLARVPNEPAAIVKVLDFGIAKAIEGDRAIDQFETLDGTVFGTPRYMSPEQAAGKQLDPRSDLYAVGTMLYELISGRPPFVDNDAVVVMARHIREQPMLLCRAAPDRPIPPNLEALVSRSLAKSPADRFQSAEEFERALSDCLPAIHRLARLERRGLHKSPLARALVSPRRALWAAASVGGVLSLAGVAFALLRGSPDSDMLAATQGRRFSDAIGSGEREAASPPPVAVQSEERRVVSIQTDPPAAAVYQDGAELGVTPLDVSMNAGSSLTVQLRKRGFADHTLQLRADDQSRLVPLRPLSAAALRSSRERPEKSTPTARLRRERSHRAPASQPAHPSAAMPAPAGLASGSPYERF
jgi:eukaryotic-like serine/threonine-protein kinase